VGSKPLGRPVRVIVQHAPQLGGVGLQRSGDARGVLPSRRAQLARAALLAEENALDLVVDGLEEVPCILLICFSLFGLL
jgi:hypothetical protein